MSKVNTYMDYADRIIMLLDTAGAMKADALVRALSIDPKITRFLLGFLFKFKLIEYEPLTDVVKLSRYITSLGDDPEREA